MVGYGVGLEMENVLDLNMSLQGNGGGNDNKLTEKCPR
jgi:hypothetical protein